MWKMDVTKRVLGVTLIMLFSTVTVFTIEGEPTVQAKGIESKTTVQPEKYAGYLWRLDAPNLDQLPRNFRTSNSPYRTDIDLAKTGREFIVQPTRQGLDALHASGSAEFSEDEFLKMLPVLQRQTSGSIYIVDLRQESHGLFNGNAVSWYGARDWGNLGKDVQEVTQDENARLQAAKGKTLLVAKLGKDKMPLDPQNMKVTDVRTEQQLIEAHGLHYFRIAATDHVWPSPMNIDRFMDFVKHLPKDAWLHFHCQAGMGRTTAFMAMYDMMRNPTVPFADIVSRQYLLGGNYVPYEVPNPKAGDWKADYYHQKARMIAKFYQYVQANYKDDFRTPWSVWLKTQTDL